MRRKESGRKKSGYRRKECAYSKYSRSKENKHQVSLHIFLNENDYRRLIGGISVHPIPNIRDFLIDNALIVADKSISEHPEELQYFFDHPDSFHPKSGNENIFKPKEIVFDIIISE